MRFGQAKQTREVAIPIKMNLSLLLPVLSDAVFCLELSLCDYFVIKFISHFERVLTSSLDLFVSTAIIICFGFSVRERPALRAVIVPSNSCVFGLGFIESKC